MLKGGAKKPPIHMGCLDHFTWSDIHMVGCPDYISKLQITQDHMESIRLQVSDNDKLHVASNR